MPFPAVPEITEKEIVQLWQKRAKPQMALESVCGESLRLVYPGRPNAGRGGDIQDAVITSSRGQQRGCIEFHRLTSGWQSHGHHRDPYYNQVILQVAWKADRGLPARLQDGRHIPTVILERLVTATERNPAEAGLFCRDYCRKKPADQIIVALESAGGQRFRQKSGRFQSRMAQNGNPQILYEGLVESLGYTQNQQAFASFSQRIPLSVFSALKNETGARDILTIQSFLLAQAGLLPSQQRLTTGTDEYIDQIELIRQASGWEALSPAPEWERYKVRPLNHPVRRLMALSHWLQRELFERWEIFLLSPVLNYPARDSRRKLQNILNVADPTYWSGFYDFGRPLSSPDAALLGRSRINAIIINVILPFLKGWADTHSFPQLSQKITGLFHTLPGMEANSIQRHMTAQLGLSHSQLNSALRQQGLVHVYKSFCTKGLCLDCPLSG